MVSKVREKRKGKHNYHARKKVYALYLLWRWNRTESERICFLLEHFPTEWKDNPHLEIKVTDNFTFQGIECRLYYELRHAELRKKPHYANILRKEISEKTARIDRYENGEF